MKRLIERVLAKWSDLPSRTPIFLSGPPKTGATTLLKTFGEEHFKHTLHLDVEDRKSPIHALLRNSCPWDDIVHALPYKTGATLENALIILENAHLDPHAIRGLSYFSTTHPDLWVIATGNYTQALAQGLNPDAVEHYHITPLNFAEYLTAVGDGSLSTILRFHDIPRLTRAHEQLLKRLDEFLLIGGMPDSIKTSLNDNSTTHTDALADVYAYIQSTLNRRSTTALNAIGGFLAENEPYSQAKVPRAGEVTLDTIEKAELCYRIPAQPKPHTASHEKIYLPDVGLLALQLGLSTTPEHSDPLYRALYSQWLIQELRYQFPDTRITYNDTFPFILHLDSGAVGISFSFEARTPLPVTSPDMPVIHLSPELWKEEDDSLIRVIPLYDAGQIGRYIRPRC